MEMTPVQKLKQEYPAYPNCNISTNVGEIKTKFKLETLVRIKREGKWYLLVCRYEYIMDTNINSAVEVMERFISQIYRVIHFSVLSSFHVEDDDQSEEENRLVEADPILKLFINEG